jgi:hypothetical protein
MTTILLGLRKSRKIILPLLEQWMPSIVFLFSNIVVYLFVELEASCLEYKDKSVSHMFFHYRECISMKLSGLQTD